jgi:hypothetical protein
MAQNTYVQTSVGESHIVSDIEIPDLWHIAKYLQNDPNKTAVYSTASGEWIDSGDAVLEVWHLAHALKRHIIEAS